MKSSVLIQNKKIYYTDQGQGTVMVLLHGYLESLDTWSSFANKLSKKFRVLSFDIPGHGASAVFSEKHSMKLLAKLIHAALSSLSINKCFMIGHSMGGYVTLMFHHLFPERLLGFSLFHSHPFADTKETQKKRLREISFVKEGKKDLIAKVNIPNAFATDHLKLFDQDIKLAIEIALQTPTDGIIANLYAMISRPDLSVSLMHSKVPFFYLLGKKDNYIDCETMPTKVHLPLNAELHILEQSGHMGFIEEEDKTLSYLQQFIVQRVKA